MIEKSGHVTYEPGLRCYQLYCAEIIKDNRRQLIQEEYINEFVRDMNSFPRTVILFRDQTHIGNTAEILSKASFI